MLGEKVDPTESAAAVEDAPLDVVVWTCTRPPPTWASRSHRRGGRDDLMSAAAAYVLHNCKTAYGYDDVRCMLLPPTDRLNGHPAGCAT